MPVELLNGSGCPDHGDMVLLLDVDGVRVVQCETCHRLVALGGLRGFVLLIKGDFWAKHRFYLGPIDIAEISLKASSHPLEDEAGYESLFQRKQEEEGDG